MKKLLAVAVAMGLTASTASAATQLNVRVVSGGESNIEVTPGQVVDYQVLGQLQDTTNQGLALFAFNLACNDCGPLPQATPPDEATTPCISQFVSPQGMNNPAGFGGTTDVPGMEGQLVQVGGATNTILNTEQFAQFPLGTVCLDLGHTEVVLAEGQLTIPNTAEAGIVYTLAISEVFANTILDGEVEDGTHWAVEAASQGTTQNLVMTTEQVCAAASAVMPACDSIIASVSNATIHIQYGEGPIALGDIQVRELLADGQFGADVTDQFDKADMGGGMVSLINDGTPLSNETWYGVTDNCGLNVQFGVVYGDVNGDGETNAFDVNEIWANRTSPPEGSIYDVNGDGAINAFDVNEAWANRNSTDLGEPTGHTTCAP